MGTICPSQSPWCSAVMLVRKKDGSLCFCIGFHKLKARTKKRFLLCKVVGHYMLIYSLRIWFRVLCIFYYIYSSSRECRAIDILIHSLKFFL